MSAELRAAVKLVRQKIQRCHVALNRNDLARLTLELTNAELAAKALGQILTPDEPQEATSGR